jgi:hypothetical protein
MTFACIGCGREPAPAKHAYGPRCRGRLRHGFEALDVDDLPTLRELQKGVNALGPAARGPGARWGR